MVVNCTGKYMQGKSADIATATDVVLSTIATMEGLRNDDTYDSVYQHAVGLFEVMGVVNSSSPVRPVHKVPAGLQDCLVMSTSGLRDTEQSDFKKDMFEILDTMTREMRARFENQKPELLACSTLMLTGKHFMEYEVMAPLAARYESLGINCDMLKGQVTVAKAMMLTKEVSLRSLKDPEDVLDHLLPLKAAFPDLVLFGQLLLTMPVSSAC